LAKELIETPGVDFNLADSSGEIPIEYATEKHNDELIALIGEHLFTDVHLSSSKPHNFDKIVQNVGMR
jgi:hypothetical protein